MLSFQVFPPARSRPLSHSSRSYARFPPRCCVHHYAPRRPGFGPSLPPQYAAANAPRPASAAPAPAPASPRLLRAISARSSSRAQTCRHCNHAASDRPTRAKARCRT
eukprot:5843193-Pleurochrysis_carterae.AAC.1